jgi:hypothetical protein
MRSHQIAIHVSRQDYYDEVRHLPQQKSPSGPKLKEYKKSLFGRELDPLDMRIVSALVDPSLNAPTVCFHSSFDFSLGTLVHRWQMDTWAKWTLRYYVAWASFRYQT